METAKLRGVMLKWCAGLHYTRKQVYSDIYTYLTEGMGIADPPATILSEMLMDNAIPHMFVRYNA